MRIPDNHLTALVRHFQAGDDSLKVDGIYGRRTAGALDRYTADNEASDPYKAFPLQHSMQLMFLSALADEGIVEVPLGSNTGPKLEGWRLEIDLPQRGGGEWCSLFLSVHCMRNGIGAKSRTARGLMRAVLALPGGRAVDPSEIRPGLVGLALKRRDTHSHHIQAFHVYRDIGSDLKVQHVGGNERHRVMSDHWYAADFFRDCLQIVTYVDQT